MHAQFLLSMINECYQILTLESPICSSLSFGENTEDFEADLMAKFFDPDAIARRQRITQARVKQQIDQVVKTAENEFITASG